MKHCILYDSSFLIATLDKGDDFHQDAVFVFKKLVENKNKIKIIIPSLVFYETIVTLVKKGGTPTKLIEQKLWNFLYSSMILNISLIETNAFKMCKQLANYDLSQLKTPDFIVINVGMEFEAQILTFDKQMRKRVGQIYPEIYYCSALGSMPDESPRFFKEFSSKLGEDIIDLDDIPF